MTFHLELSPDAEARLKAQAAASGLTADEFARRVLESAVLNGSAGVRGLGTGTLSPEESLRRLRGLEEWHRQLRDSGTTADDSRESIYGDRGA